MKKDAFLINTARGEVIDEHALIQALMFDTIGGAALDVFDGEPRIAPDLMQCDNLVMLPHLGLGHPRGARGDGVPRARQPWPISSQDVIPATG